MVTSPFTFIYCFNNFLEAYIILHLSITVSFRMSYEIIDFLSCSLERSNYLYNNLLLFNKYHFVLKLLINCSLIYGNCTFS